MYAVLSWTIDDQSLQKDQIRDNLLTILDSRAWTRVAGVTLVDVSSPNDFVSFGAALEQLYADYRPDFDYVCFYKADRKLRPVAVRSTWPNRNKIKSILS
jgi:hypothetical protein